MHMYILHNQGPRIRWKKNFQTRILKIEILCTCNYNSDYNL